MSNLIASNGNEKTDVVQNDKEHWATFELAPGKISELRFSTQMPFIASRLRIVGQMRDLQAVDLFFGERSFLASPTPLFEVGVAQIDLQYCGMDFQHPLTVHVKNDTRKKQTLVLILEGGVLETCARCGHEKAFHDKGHFHDGVLKCCGQASALTDYVCTCAGWAPSEKTGFEHQEAR